MVFLGFGDFEQIHGQTGGRKRAQINAMELDVHIHALNKGNPYHLINFLA